MDDKCLEHNGGCDPHATCWNRVAQRPVCQCKAPYWEDAGDGSEPGRRCRGRLCCGVSVSLTMLALGSTGVPWADCRDSCHRKSRVAPIRSVTNSQECSVLALVPRGDVLQWHTTFDSPQPILARGRPVSLTIVSEVDLCGANRGGCDKNANCIARKGESPVCKCFDGFKGGTTPGDVCEGRNQDGATYPLSPYHSDATGGKARENLLRLKPVPCHLKL